MIGKKRVAITGIGPLASTGIGRDAFWKGILEKRTGIDTREYSIDGDMWGSFPVGKFSCP
jgi:hypothetical protein